MDFLHDFPMIFNHHLSSAYLLDLIPENHPTKFNSGLGPLKANMAGKSPCFMGDTLTQMGCLYVVYPIKKMGLKDIFLSMSISSFLLGFYLLLGCFAVKLPNSMSF